MPRIIVISDTHWSQPENYAPRLGAICTGADLIIHAGDAVEGFVLRWLEQLAPVKAVVGNCDRATVRQAWPSISQFDVGGVRIGLFHGHQVNLNRPESIVQAFPDKTDLIIHGHTHLADYYHHKGVGIFNPGSFSDPRGDRGPTWGEIVVADGVLRACHHDL